MRQVLRPTPSDLSDRNAVERTLTASSAHIFSAGKAHACVLTGHKYSVHGVLHADVTVAKLSGCSSARGGDIKYELLQLLKCLKCSRPGGRKNIEGDSSSDKASKCVSYLLRPYTLFCNLMCSET